jgi:monoamine oxidase
LAETFAPAGNGVAIVGAGAAGVAAAAELRAHGVPALVLEARGRTGGRAFTDVSVPGAPFDRGASYIHAADQGNPWAAIARAAGADVTLDGRRRLFLDRGRPLDPAPFEAALTSAWRSLAQAGSAGWQGAAGGCCPRRARPTTTPAPWSVPG